MFKSIKLDEETMWKWHQIFEKKHPEDHQFFLEWLKLPQPEIKEIRTKAKDIEG